MLSSFLMLLNLILGTVNLTLYFLTPNNNTITLIAGIYCTGISLIYLTGLIINYYKLRS